MRKLVFQALTTLNGRLDNPNDWLPDIADDLYNDLNQIYDTFDTVLAGRTTYEEMFAYWPKAETATHNSENDRHMAHKMNTYKKFVFSRGGLGTALPWNNAEPVITPHDDDLVGFINRLKSQPGRDLHLAGGPRFAQAVIRLGLVDEYHFFVYPMVSPGLTWFEDFKGTLNLDLILTHSYQNGVVSLFFKPKLG